MPLESKATSTRTSVSHIEEGSDHPRHRPEEADHRRPSGDSSQQRQALLKATNLDITDILYDDQYIRHRTANASQPLADHASVGRIRVFAELDSGGSLALEYVVLDALNEVLVLTSSSTELEVLRDEDIDPEERKCQEDDHDPSALGG